jgi:hypothetical protein
MLIPPSQTIRNHLYLVGIILLAVGLPWSKFMMSLSLLILSLNWLLDKNLVSKFKSFCQNKTAFIIGSVFLLHLLGLLYTRDFNYGMEDVRKKIPLLLLPLIFSTTPALSKKNIELVLYLFISSVAVATFICFYILLG